MELKAVRGMHDLLGEELERWTEAEARLRTVFAAFGYGEIRTPVLEKIEVFSQTVGDETDIVEKQMYTILDQSSEKMVLRPEGTASFMRAIIEHQQHRTGQTQRYYYYLPMFRHERPQKGRLRQFHQFGAELINDPSPEADAEIIALLDHVCREFAIPSYEARINSVGCGDCRPVYKEVLKDYFRPHLETLCEQCRKRFERSPMRILDCKSETCKAIARNAPLITGNLCDACRAHHGKLKARLKQLDVAFVDDPNIVRGLDYYCRTAFEFTSNLLGAQSAIGGGGRYDGLSTRFGEKPFPAVGFALGMERLMMATGEKGREKRGPVFSFVALGETAFDRIYPLAVRLKRRGVWAELGYDPQKSLKSQLKQADRLGARYTLILGETELAQAQALLKDMRNGTQESLPLEGIEEALIRRTEIAS